MASYSFLVLLPFLAVATAEIAIVCEHGTGHIKCPAADQFIKINSADYGRVGNKICTRHYAPHADQLNKKTPCKYDVTHLIKAKCERKKDCSFVATNGNMKRDPCVGTYKFLTVNYSCKTKPVKLPTDEIVKKKKICEDDSATLQCPKDTVIKISSANYGRKNRNGCQDGRGGIYNKYSSQLNPATPCKLDVKDNLKQKCDNRRSCEVHSTNAAFTDPCKHIYKMTRVTYKCIEEPEPKPVKKDICEHHKAQISCPPGMKINIKTAVYGRTDKSTCLNQYNPGVRTDCARDVKSRVQAFCQGQESCEVVSTNGAYGDPCWGTYKYTALKYTCESDVKYKPKPIFMDICEWRSGHISCPPGKTITLINSVYGRTDKAVCTLNMGPSHGALQKTDCQKDVKSMVSYCQGKQTCHLTANNGKFTDPCVGTFKYLETNYLCE